MFESYLWRCSPHTHTKICSKSFMHLGCIAVKLPFKIRSKVNTETILVFSFQLDNFLLHLSCNTVSQTTHEILKHLWTLSLAFFFVSVKIVLLKAICFTEGERKKTRITSNLCVPTQRIEITLRLHCNFRLRKWNRFHPGIKGEENGKEKTAIKKCFLSISFDFSYFSLLQPDCLLKYMFNIEMVKVQVVYLK